MCRLTPGARPDARPKRAPSVQSEFVASLRPLVRSLAFVLALLFALSACGDGFRQPAAVVHGVEITDAQVKEATPEAKVLTALLRTSCGTPVSGEPSRSPCLRYTVGYLVEREVIREYAEANDISVAQSEVETSIGALRQQYGKEQLQAILDQYGVDEQGLERLVRDRLRLVRVQEAVGSAAVGNDVLRRAYERRKADFTLLHAAHILVPNKAQADRIAAEVTPDNFAELAKKFSIDQVSAKQGGDLGSVPVGQLDSQFVQGALALQPGEISQPVQSRFGWHIIRLISVNTAPFEQVRLQLARELQGPAIQRWFTRQIQDDVEVNPRYGRLDPETGSVVPLNSTATAIPSPSPLTS